MKKLVQKYKHGFLFLYALIYLPWFMYLEKTITKHYHVIHMDIDDKIPFNEYFIIPYMLWFLYVSGVVLYLFFKDTSDFYKCCAFLFTGMTLFLIISTIYPNGHHLRPEFFERDNIFVQAVQALYQTDTPTNIFPSIHVYNSIGAHLAVMQNEKLKQNKWITTGSFILMVSICMATVFLKQHSMFDVITGIILAFIMYEIVYRVDYAAIRNKRMATDES